MTELPVAVKTTLQDIKKKHKHTVGIAVIRGGYYVYETLQRFVKEENRYRTFSLYLGKIEENGVFVEARHRKESTKLGSIEEMVRKKEQSLRDDSTNVLLHSDKINLKVLEMISTDARISISEIADTIGMSRVVTRHRLKMLEQKFDIKYTVEFGYSFFGFFRYAIFVKFLHKKPDFNKIKDILEKEPTVQYAALLKGAYDLFIYIFAETSISLEYKIYEIRSNPELASYASIWNTSYILNSYGYMPTRSRFFEILKEKVWHKSKETPKKNSNQLLEREYIVLKELNENSREDFSDIDKKYEFNTGTSQYTYHRLIERKIIYRATITMENLPFRYMAISKCSQLNISDFNDKRDIYLLDVIQETDLPINKYVLIGDIALPAGLLYITCVFNDGELELIEKNIEKSVKGSEVESYVVIKTLVGELGFRKLDNTLAPQYKLLPFYKRGDLTAHAIVYNIRDTDY